jgi:hypothetical protein
MSRKLTTGSSVTDLVGVMPKLNLDGGAVAEWPFPELGAETFKAGEMVCLSGTTTTNVGLTKPLTDASGVGIVGFAADNASGFCSSFVGVHVALPNVVFVGNVGHSLTSANAQTQSIDIGQLYGLTSLSGRTYVDKAKGLANTSTAMCRVLGFFDQDVVPTFYGRVYFKVLADKCQLDNNIWLNTSSPVSVAI